MTLALLNLCTCFGFIVFTFYFLLLYLKFGFSFSFELFSKKASLTVAMWIIIIMEFYGHKQQDDTTWLFKFSSLSTPTKIEELTAGSDEKTTAQSDPAVSSSIFVGVEREENLITNDPDKIEFTTTWLLFNQSTCNTFTST